MSKKPKGKKEKTEKTGLAALPGRLNVSKTIKLIPGLKMRYNIRSGFTAIVGVTGLNYSIPIGKPKILERFLKKDDQPTEEELRDLEMNELLDE